MYTFYISLIFTEYFYKVTGQILFAAAVISPVHLATAQLIHTAVLWQTHLWPDLERKIHVVFQRVVGKMDGIRCQNIGFKGFSGG